MTIRELILKLNEFDQDLSVTLDTCEGVEFLDIDQVYENKKGVVLYASIMNVNQTQA